KLEAVNQLYTPQLPVTHTQVADHLLTTFEGAFVLSKVMNEPKLASEQLIQCRNYLELLYRADS
ncbi:MAG: hypothetical protein AB2687_10435, partial [Candidatus Thiodiazotropha taylori]